MLESVHPSVETPALAPRTAAEQALVAGWRTGLAIVNLRGDAQDPGFCSGVAQAVGLDVPTQPCTSVANDTHRLVWVGPDDWFVIGPAGQAADLEARLRAALAGQHVAVTDVSSAYSVLHLSGPPVREVLAQGCPLDLHPRAFGPGDSAGSLFFKASMWLWQTEAQPVSVPVYEVLVRTSFKPYFWLMLERCTPECGLVQRGFAS